MPDNAARPQSRSFTCMHWMYPDAGYEADEEYPFLVRPQKYTHGVIRHVTAHRANHWRTRCGRPIPDSWALVQLDPGPPPPPYPKPRPHGDGCVTVLVCWQCNREAPHKLHRHSPPPHTTPRRPDPYRRYIHEWPALRSAAILTGAASAESSAAHAVRALDALEAPMSSEPVLRSLFGAP